MQTGMALRTAIVRTQRRRFRRCGRRRWRERRRQRGRQRGRRQPRQGRRQKRRQGAEQRQGKQSEGLAAPELAAQFVAMATRRHESLPRALRAAGLRHRAAIRAQAGHAQAGTRAIATSNAAMARFLRLHPCAGLQGTGHRQERPWQTVVPGAASTAETARAPARPGFRSEGSHAGDSYVP